MNTRTDNPALVGVHKFTQAGLGQAPFVYVGMGEKTYQACHGAPVQPAGTCDYCGNCIRYVFSIRSADGKVSGVGCDCIQKAGDAGLMKAYKRSKEWRAIQKTKRDAKAVRDKAELVALIDTHGPALAALPHPSAWRAEKKETALDSVRWYLANAGATGRAAALKWAKRTLGLDGKKPAAYADAHEAAADEAMLTRTGYGDRVER